MSEEKKSGLEKAAVILGVTFLISAGLCGVNLVAVSDNIMKGADGFLFVTAYLEVFGMAISGIGLLALAVIAIVRALIDTIRSRGSNSVSIIEKNEDK